MSDPNLLPAMEDEPNQVEIDSHQAVLLRRTIAARKLQPILNDTPLLVPLIVTNPDIVI